MIDAERKQSVVLHTYLSRDSSLRRQDVSL
jgi:hypothetical protein